MAIDIDNMFGRGHELGIQRAKLPVYDCGSESGNEELEFLHPVRELFIANDSKTADLTVEVGCPDGTMTLTLKHCETLDERFQEFTRVTVTASGPWRWIVRSGRVD